MVGCCPVPSVTSWGCGIVWSMYRQPALLRPGPGSQQLAASTMWPWQSPFPGCLLASSRLSWTRPAACQAHHSTDVPLNNNNNNNNINYNLCLSVNLICRKKQRQLQQNDHLRKRLAFVKLHTLHWHFTSHWTKWNRLSSFLSRKTNSLFWEGYLTQPQVSLKV